MSLECRVVVGSVDPHGRGSRESGGRRGAFLQPWPTPLCTSTVILPSNGNAHGQDRIVGDNRKGKHFKRMKDVRNGWREISSITLNARLT